jgi:DHA2 family multidrug resistance protein
MSTVLTMDEAAPGAPLAPPLARAAPQAQALPAEVDGPAVLPLGLRLVVTATLLAATFMEVVDTSIVNVALPNMQGKLGVTLDEVSWVSTAYIISNVIFLPLTAWLADQFGRKRYLTYSLILFTAASFGCGASSQLWTLVLFRFLQGAGGAAFLSTSQATLIEIWPNRLQGVASALFGMGVVMAPTVGPTIGGYLTDHYAWPWIFFVNLPIGAVAIVLTLAVVPDSLSAGQKRAADLLGIGLLAVGLGALQTVLERGEADDWFESQLMVGLMIAASVALAGFALWELRAATKAPAVDLRLLTDRNLLVGSLYAAILGFLLYGSVFSVPQFLQGLQGHTAQQTGLLLFPGGLATVLGMAVVSRLITRLDPRVLVGAGMACYLGSSVLMADHLTVLTPDSAFFWPLILRGLGFGLAFVPLSLIALGTLEPRKVAQGAGLYNLFRQLGGSFGIAMLTTVLSRKQKVHLAQISEHVTAFDPATQERLALLKAGLIQHGYPPGDAETGALKLLAGTLSKQAYLMAFVDVFRSLAWMAALGLALVFLFGKAKRKVDPSAAAH